MAYFRLLRVVRRGFGVLLLAALPASAATWVCSLSDDGTRLVCAADVDAAAAGQSPTISSPTVVSGTRFPLDPARVYVVPLWAPPIETEMVAQLARATICHRSDDCSVVLASSPWFASLTASPRRP